MRRLITEQIVTIKRLRKEGKSISDIMQVTGLPKTTVWHHVQGVKIPPLAMKIIKSSQGGSKKRRELALVKAREEVDKLLASADREISLIVGMLYWAEGSKRELVFTNTDVHMVKLYLHFLRKILKVEESDIHLLIRISDPLKPSAVIRFWSTSTNTRVSQIRINHDNKHNKTKSINGICRVNLKKNSYYLKQIQCIIDAVKETHMPL